MNSPQGGLAVESLRKNYPSPSGDLVVLRDVTFSLERGEMLAIMGPSGSGKSTLLNIIGTLEPPSAGSVRIDGRDPFSLSPRELARFRNRHIGFIFQEHHLLPQCSTLENVLVPTLADRRSNEEVLHRARHLLDRVGLAHRADHRPAELSGGERQRVAIARALIHQPAILLADEPTGNLDRTSADTIASLLIELPHEVGATLIVVTHSDRLAQQFQKRMEMNDGMLFPR